MDDPVLRSAAKRLRPSARNVLRRGLRLLPPPRDAAALALGRAALDLVAGRAPAGAVLTADDRTVDPRLLGRARRAMLDDDLPAAVAAAEAVLAAHPGSTGALEVLYQAHYRGGEPTASLVALRGLRRLADRPEREALDAKIVGLLRESDPAWLPRVPGPPERLEPAAPGRVLHLLKGSVPHSQSGYTMRSHYNLRAQRDGGLEPVAVTALGFPRSVGRAAAVLEEVDGIRFHRLDLGAAYPADVPADRYLEDFAWAAAGVVEAERPAMLHAGSGHHGYEVALVGLALRERYGLPLVYEVRGFFETTWTTRPGAESAELARRRFAAENRVMAEADAVVTIAESMRDDIVARGIPADKVFVVPNGVDAARFSPRPAPDELRRRHDLRGFVFGYISNLDFARENQELLIEAAVRLRRHGREVTCLIVGDGTRRAELERRAREARAGNAVVFTGAVPHAQVTDYYAVLDAFVVPRRDERAARHVTPLKPYEAMAMRRPLVVADLPALTEIAAPGVRGLAFPPDDADALVACLERLMDDPALAAGLGGAGHDWVVRERAWAANVARFEAAYAHARAARGVAG